MTEIEKNIKKMADEIPVPEGISPEKIEKQLKQSRRRKNRRPFVAAATAVFVIGTGIMIWNTLPQKITTPKITIPVEHSKNKQEQASDQVEKKEEHKSYEELRQSIQTYLSQREKERTVMTEGDLAYAAADAVMPKDEAVEAKSTDYTKTNVQVEGIDEADIVKTDGNYIYSYIQDAVSSKIYIVKAAGKESRQIGTITLEDVQAKSLYLKDKWLVVLAEKQKDKEENSDAGLQTMIYMYDVSDPQNPVCRSKNSQSGYYSDSRLSGDILYTISIKTVEKAGKKAEKEEYIPEADGKIIPEDRLYCPILDQSAQYVVMQSIDLSQGGKQVDQMATLGAEGIYYVSENNIYVAAGYTDSESWRKTKISRYSYKKGKIRYECDRVINGTILNQFSMDEYEGKLRFVATTYDDGGTSTNGLYILDESLKTVGSVSRLAAGEWIYSARFMGNKAYFVTYRETDPLFLVDMSDPEKPVVKDKLKIPGFSDYLHPFGENKLLGIGSIQDKNGNTHVKLSMFDISNPEKVKEIHSKKLGINTTENIGNDPKGILVDVERNRIGFGVEEFDVNGSGQYQIFTYDEKRGFQKITKMTLENYNIDMSRGLYLSLIHI